MIGLAYDVQLSRVRVTASSLPAGTTTARVDRSLDGITWTTVRGALELAVSAGSLERPADDYEFVADELNTYRVTSYDAAGLELGAETGTITPALAEPWLKVIARPFLNRPVVVQDYSDVERPARAGVHEVVGRSLPVVVSDVRGSRRFELVLVTETPAQARELELALSTGDPVFLHVPADCDVPAGYLAVGDVAWSRPSRRSVRRLFVLPVTEIAAPGPDVVGATSTWTTVLGAFATWQEMIAAKATWADVLELIGNPEDVIVE